MGIEKKQKEIKMNIGIKNSLLYATTPVTHLRLFRQAGARGGFSFWSRR